MAEGERVDRIRSRTAKRYADMGIELEILNYYGNKPTTQPLSQLSSQLWETIEESGCDAIICHSMAVEMLRKLAPRLAQFDGSIVLIEGPNSASLLQVAYWSATRKRLPLVTTAERDIIKTSAFMRSLTETKLGLVKPLEIGGYASAHWPSKSAFTKLQYTAHLDFRDLHHIDLLFDVAVQIIIGGYILNPMAALETIEAQKNLFKDKIPV